MPDRITDNDLSRMVNILNARTDQAYDFTIQYAYGKPRLHRKGYSVDVSPRLSKRELYEWIDAYLEGLSLGLDVQARRARYPDLLGQNA